MPFEPVNVSKTPKPEPEPEKGQRLLARVHVEVVTGLRFIRERPNSLIDDLHYARSGEWTTEIDGPRRHAALAWVWFFSIPVKVIGYLLIWQTGRPTRFFTCMAVELLLATALNQLPLLGWFIPDWADLSTWPPFCWL